MTENIFIFDVRIQNKQKDNYMQTTKQVNTKTSRQQNKGIIRQQTTEHGNTKTCRQQNKGIIRQADNRTREY